MRIPLQNISLSNSCKHPLGSILNSFGFSTFHGCRLTFIDQKAFQNLAKLTLLFESLFVSFDVILCSSITRNALTYLPPGIFSSLTAIRQL
jgi:hypothetical protein